MKNKLLQSVYSEMTISRHIPEPTVSWSEKIKIFIASVYHILLISFLKFQFRSVVVAIRPLVFHLENNIFPELVISRIKWFRLDLIKENSGTLTVSGKSGSDEYTFPGTTDIACYMELHGLKSILLNTSLEHNQMVEALLLFLHAKKQLSSTHTTKTETDNTLIGRNRIASAMRGERGFHCNCMDLHYIAENATFRIDYSYCRLFMVRLMSYFTVHLNRFGDHRIYYTSANVVSAFLFLLLCLPIFLSLTGIHLIHTFYAAIVIIVPVLTFLTLRLLGAIFYEKEHDELLKKEYIRREKNLARFPEINPSPVIKTANDGTILYANPASFKLAKQLFDSTDISQILPTGFETLVHPSLHEDMDFIVEEMEIKLKDHFIRYLITPVDNESAIIFTGSDVTELRKAEKSLRDMNIDLEKLVIKRTNQLYQTQDTTITCLAGLADVRDPETGAHIERTRKYVKTLAEHLKNNPSFSTEITDTMIDKLFKSAPLHDIGKVGIPDNILLKPGVLTVEEFELMKKHTTFGATALQTAIENLGFDSFLNIAYDIALSHHEKWDGTGYPLGLKGREIPVAARLMALADVYDALINRRVYKEPFPHDKTKAIILDGKGKHFDPDVVDAFVACENKFIVISEAHPDTPPDAE